MIKVLHIMTDATLGGAGRVLLQLLGSIDRSRFDVAVTVPRGSVLVELVKALDFRVIETKKGQDRSYEWGAVKEYKKIIKAERPDIVHTHSSFAGKLAAYFCGVKSRISTRHCAFDALGRLSKFPFKQINGAVNNMLSTAFIAVAKPAARNLLDTGIDPKKVHIIINGVDPMRSLSEEEKASFRASLGIAAEEFVCLLSARMEPTKGHEMLIDAALAVQKSAERPVRFIFMGDGSCRERIEEKRKNSGAADLVLLTGFLEDVAPYYNICDLNLNASFGVEASSLALAEGMSLGKPAVVTDCGGNPYMISHEVNGLVVPQRDPSAMAEAILRIIKDDVLRQRLSEGAQKEYTEKFTARAMTAQVEALYERNIL